MPPGDTSRREERTLDYYRYRKTSDTVRRSASQHGYTGRLASVRYLLAKLSDYFLMQIAYHSPLASLRVICQRKRGVQIGDGVLIGYNVMIDPIFPEYIQIGDGASLAGQNWVLAHSTPLEYHKNDFESFVAPVTIGKNAWLTIGAVVLPGVTIGEGAVVAAGSVVTNDIPAHTFAGGVPAKVIRPLSRHEEYR